MGTPEVLIRAVEETDIINMWPIVQFRSDSDKENFIARVKLKRKLEDHFIPVALMGNKVVGYAWVHDYGPHIRVGHRKARLNDLYVLEEYQRQGIGKKLFLSVRDWCERRNVKWLEWQSNESAISFYEKMGYKGERCPDPDHPEFEITFETKKEIFY